jgi:short-subunit dehydrogenase
VRRSEREILTSELFNLIGQVAIVTGASRGLGQHMARALAKAKANLVVTSRDPRSLAAFETEVKESGRRVLPLELRPQPGEYSAYGGRLKSSTAASIFFVNSAGCNVA